MIKNLLNEKEKEIFDYTARPFIINCVVVAIIVGSNFGNMSSDTVNGFVCSMTIMMLINCFNASCIVIKNMGKKFNRETREDEHV